LRFSRGASAASSEDRSNDGGIYKGASLEIDEHSALSAQRLVLADVGALAEERVKKGRRDAAALHLFDRPADRGAKRTLLRRRVTVGGEAAHARVGQRQTSGDALESSPSISLTRRGRCIGAREQASLQTNERHAAGRTARPPASTAACQRYYPTAQRLTITQNPFLAMPGLVMLLCEAFDHRTRGRALTLCAI
jgi:hypothetical protein